MRVQWPYSPSNNHIAIQLAKRGLLRVACCTKRNTFGFWAFCVQHSHCGTPKQHVQNLWAAGRGLAVPMWGPPLHSTFTQCMPVHNNQLDFIITYSYQVRGLVYTEKLLYSTCVFLVIAYHTKINKHVHMGLHMILGTSLGIFDSVLEATHLMWYRNCFMIYPVSCVGPCNN